MALGMSLGDLERAVKSAIEDSDVLSSLESDVSDGNDPVSEDDSSSDGDLEVVLDKGGRSHATVACEVDGEATLEIHISSDEDQWWEYDSIDLDDETTIEQIPWIGFRYVRARVPDTGIDVDLEISSSQ